METGDEVSEIVREGLAGYSMVRMVADVDDSSKFLIMCRKDYYSDINIIQFDP